MENEVAAPDPLLEAGQLEEQPFKSDVPFIGSLLAGFRSAWNGVATKWYARPLIQQQTLFNTAVARRLSSLDDSIDSLEERLIDLDREQTEQRRQAAELALYLKGLERRIVAIETLLASEKEASVNSEIVHPTRATDQQS